ncbi:Ig-like domain-containing protein [Pseudomonas chlororaphis]|uniref:Ig-like domain-containing protein n=1 Tax=Pseudomonas chlororaphis TaxID=587753 RepID=UPI0023672D92|nr:Ig-like domain-containing protein [Pseudomonas chlororaphis]WDH22094.1 Ig-like domain-containing protein [Pseudomonas chlororaphis]
MTPSKKKMQTSCNPSGFETPSFFQRGESFRRTALLCLSLQLFSVASAVAAPLLNSEGASVGTFSGTQLYTLKAGESVSSIAKKYGLTLTELEKFNALPTFNKPFSELTIGDELLVPAGPAEVAVKSMPDPEKAEGAYVGAVKQLGGIVASDNAGRDAASMAKGAAVVAMNQEAQAWLNQFGTARAQINVDDKGNLYGSAVDILVPLVDTKHTLLFSQVGGRNQDSRNTLNLGAGVRHHMTEQWLLGLNAFYDVDMTNHNRRLGVGAEAFHDNLKLAANSYMRLSNWRQSQDFADYDERPANGYDIRAQAYLPSYPQLGGKLMYEKYYGKDVALFGKNDRQSDPQAVTVGLEHTPFPLMTWGIDHKSGSGGQSDTQIKLGFTYRIGESLSKQVDPSAVAAMRSVAGSRLDLVERNNNIVLDYQKQVLLNMSLPTKAGVGSSADTLVASLTSKYPLAAVEWDTSALVAAGGSAMPDPSNKLALNFTYPPAVNTYLVSAIARDVNGNSTARIITSIVTIFTAEIASGALVMITDKQLANGTAQNVVQVKVTDASGNPVANQVVGFAATNGATIAASGTTNAAGIVEMPLTSTTAGISAVTASVGSSTQSVNSTFIADAGSAEIASGALVMITDKQLANGTAQNVVQVKVTDASGNPVANQVVGFAATNGATIAASGTTNAAGIVEMPLTSTTAGISAVTASVGSSTQSVNSTFIADAGSAEIASGALVMITDKQLANGTAQNVVQVKVTDASGNPVANQVVGFAATNGATIAASGTTNAAGIVEMPLTSTTAGISAVTASVGSSTQSVNSTFIADAGSAEIASGALVMITDKQLANGTAQNVVQVKVTDASGNPVANQVVGFAATNGATIAASGTTNAAGIVEMPLTSTTAGISAVTASVGSSTQSVNSTFIADAGSAEIASGALVMITDKQLANGTAQNVVQVKVTDASGNPVANQVVGFAATNGATIAASGTTNAAGIVEMPLTSTTAGISAVTASVGSSTQSVNSTFIADAGSAEIASGALVMITDKQLANGTAQNVVQVKVTDASGNPVANQVVGFAATNGATIAASGTTNAAGIVEMPLTSTTAGISAVTASVGSSTQSVNSTFIADAGSAEIASGALVMITDKQLANGTAQNVVQVKVTDASGNPVANQVVGFAATNGATIAASGTTNAAGIVEMPLTSTTAGISAVTASVGSSTQSVNSTFIADAGSAEIASGALVMITDKQLANGTAQNVVQVKVTDASGNPVANQVVGFAATNGATIAASGTTNAAGIVEMPLTSTTAGISAVTASVGSSTQSVNSTFIADAGSAEIASGALVMITDKQLANGTAQNVVQVKVTDASGNPVPTQAVTFSVESGGAKLTDTTATTNASGVASMTLTSFQAGISTLKASINGSESTVDTTFAPLTLVDTFVKPNTALMPWALADAHCKAIGARLPTRDELGALWDQGTVGRPSNSEMCSVHGWPLRSPQCGGKVNIYWTSTPSLYSMGMHYNVNLSDGGRRSINRDDNTLQVACVR